MGGVLKGAGGLLAAPAMMMPDGAKDSAEQFLGMKGGPTFQGDSTLNDQYRDEMKSVDDHDYNQALMNYAQGDGTGMDALKGMANPSTAQMNNLATNPLTGSRFATEQVQNNPVLGQLYGKGGQMQNEIGQYGQQSGILDKLQNQGYELKPEDQSLYGQASGNIARQFGQQGNNAASNLAARGLSSSGAAGAAFSGLAGNQNEMLAQAQQGIMQQRFQNTMNQIGQQQQFLGQMGNNINNMGSNANTAINNQYGRQLSGAQDYMNNLGAGAGNQNNANVNNLKADQFNAANKPANFMDFAAAGAGSSVQNAFAAPGKQISQNAGGGGGMFGGGGAGGAAMM